MNDMKRIVTRIGKRLLWLALAVSGVLCTLSLMSCRTREVERQSVLREVRTDTLRLFALRVDTLRQRDSIFVRETASGDTVRIESHHYHVTYRTQLLRDTVYAVRTDTVRSAVDTRERTRPNAPFSIVKCAVWVVVCGGVAYFIVKRFQ